MGNAPSPPTGRLLPRVVTLLLSVALAELWIARHLGIGTETPIVAGSLALVSAVWGGLGKLLPDAQQHLQQQAHRLVECVAGSRLPYALAAALALIGSFLSSVTLTPEAGTARATISDARNPASEDALVETRSFPKLVWSSPFGRAYWVEVPGYRRERVVVYPLLGTTLVPERDLRPAPSILLRLATEVTQALNSGAQLVVVRAQSAARTASLQLPATRNLSAVMIGERRAVPAELIGLWSLELTAEGAPPQALARQLLAWQRPQHVPTESLAPGTEVVARVLMPNGNVFAETQIVVGDELVQDERLFGIPDASSGGHLP